MQLINGNCLEKIKEMPDNSVDSIVTDPPYGLSFMGKKWDYDVPSQEIWAECLRVLKPGGYLLAFAGTRTQHRMAVRIEDAGFEIRDMIAWVYGSGFPKSLDVSKAIDKAAGAEREVVATERNYGVSKAEDGKQAYGDYAGEWNITAPATPAAQQWQGWGTALKPSYEPVTVARKPLIGTVAENVLRYGTGGVNVDGCRVGTDDVLSFGSRELGDGIKYGKRKPTTEGVQNPQGRWPANLIHDGSEEVLAGFPVTRSGGAPTAGDRNGNTFGEFEKRSLTNHGVSEGSAARFFYCAKASKRDRGEGNIHPTVKPTDLMRYLCRLVTPPNGVVLDPFMGSGSTGKAAMLEGFDFIGIELNADYFAIAEARILAARTLL